MTLKERALEHCKSNVACSDCLIGEWCHGMVDFSSDFDPINLHKIEEALDAAPPRMSKEVLYVRWADTCNKTEHCANCMLHDNCGHNKIESIRDLQRQLHIKEVRQQLSREHTNAFIDSWQAICDDNNTCKYCPLYSCCIGPKGIWLARKIQEVMEK